MNRFTLISFFSVFIAFTGFSQKGKQQVFFVDTSYSGFNQTIYLELLDSLSDIKNLNPIYLESQYDPTFTNFSSGELRGTYALNEESEAKSVVTYTPSCQPKPAKIIDSIDVTGDGVKEVFLIHETSCYVRSSHEGPYGEGSQGHEYGTYEVWDVQRKKKIAEIESIHESRVAISTNVMMSFGYQFEVEVTKSGEFIVSGETRESGYEPGTYVYNIQTGKLEKKP